MSIFKKIIGISSVVFLLSGCFGPSTAEKIQTIMESSVKLENSFATKEGTIGELEQKEQVIYNKITEMKPKEVSGIQSLANEASGLADKRKKRIEIERKYILSAKKEFQQVTPLSKDLEKGTELDTVLSAEKVMNERYKIYDDLYNSYIEGIKDDKELYQLLQKEDITLDDFQKQVKKSNDSYKKVQDANQKFNEKTIEFNKLKNDFYKAAGLKVKNK